MELIQLNVSEEHVIRAVKSADKAEIDAVELGWEFKKKRKSG